MAILREIRAKARQTLPPVIAVCVMGYFGYHSVQGDRGVLAYLRLQDELAKAEILEAQLSSQRQHLERQVELLNRKGLDLDLLGERARLLLNYGLEDEYLVLLPRSEARE